MFLNAKSSCCACAPVLCHAAPRLKNFNAAIEEQHQKQVQWSIPDAELQKAVRLSIANVLLPHYREFLKRYR